MKEEFIHYYKIVKHYNIISDCNDVYTRVQDCLNLLDRKDQLNEYQIKFINDTYQLI